MERKGVNSQFGREGVPSDYTVAQRLDLDGVKISLANAKAEAANNFASRLYSLRGHTYRRGRT